MGWNDREHQEDAAIEDVTDREERIERRIVRLQDTVDQLVGGLPTREDLMALQDDINAALQGDADAIKALTDRVTKNEAAKDAALAAANQEIADLKAQHPTVDFQALEAKLAEIKASADAVNPDQPAPGPNPPPNPPAPSAGMPLYTFDGDPATADSSWTQRGQTSDTGKPLFTYAADTAGGPATGDGLGGVWHVYRGVVTPGPAGAAQGGQQFGQPA